MLIKRGERRVGEGENRASLLNGRVFDQEDVDHKGVLTWIPLSYWYINFMYGITSYREATLFHYHMNRSQDVYHAGR